MKKIKNKNKNGKDRKEKRKRKYFFRKKNINKKYDDSFISDLSILDEKDSLIQINKEKEEEIILKGYLIYRTTFNQIEIIGNYMYNNIELPFAYLLNKEYNNFAYKIPTNKIISSNNSTFNKKNLQGDNFYLNIGINNITQILIINNIDINQFITPFFSGQYIGYYIKDNKTIEEQFFLSFLNNNISLQQIKLIGYGNNDNGEFLLNGNIHFYRDKIELISKNKNKPSKIDINSNIYGAIYLGQLQMTKTQSTKKI